MRSAFALLSLAFAAVSFAAPATNTGSGTGALFQRCNRPGVFALTFDDGPNENSYGLAKYLHSENITATFFTNSRNFFSSPFDTTTTETEDGTKTYQEVLQYYDQLGHEVASHTFSHAVLTRLNADQVAEELNLQSDTIFRAIGKRPAFMRPPEGATNEAVNQVISSLGYSNINWDVDTKDYEHLGLATEEERVRAIVDLDVPGVTLGHIALQHDVHADSVNILTPWLVQYLRSKNYTFVTVSDCIGLPAYQ
ncbi:uncharacterized protein EV154DRAFT_490772 [Mucor mucedo]|uniref:uncharacterized protein n=1 Tax=Mucor mucedo TaxID=29922 RepID=UPI00221F46A9|nr:uncharacterized protein EV154DRAFT_490772 [Mucor mucedo]KAI7896765.1 hypothetical protein EV154DRAFT_490772 [Mucor mucedo]